ncbi:MAG: RNase J family beta-CASP ribonuclease [Archaeoglobi archaeon]|nr:RNase J family beta-CASP ribonuclease [Candidatus Mnemosynella sp.]
MDVSIIGIGGYEEVGRNMTGVKVGRDIILCDMGLRLDRVLIHEDVELEKMHSLDLINIGAIPDDTVLSKVNGRVRAIVCTHGHLDHIGAIPKLAHRYDVPIISTPFTTELISEQIKQEKKFGVENNLISLSSGRNFRITDDIELEFVNVQHSIVDCVFAVLHTPRGAIVYANDFKFDRTPVIGEPPDFTRLREIGREGVLALITESVRVNEGGRTPSERIASNMLTDVLMSLEEERGIIVTTFSSHLARIKTIVEVAEKMGRTPVLFGRSMERYSQAGVKMGIIEKRFECYSNRAQVEKKMKEIMREGKEKYLPVVTGHQGEPGAVLTRISDGKTPFVVEKGDNVIFSSSAIPAPVNVANRYAVETKLRMKGARLYPNVHVSGHAYREDHRDLIRMLQPEHIIPTHGSIEMTGAYVELAEEEGYVLGSTVHILRNSQELIV